MESPSPELRTSMTPFKKRLLHRVEDSARHYPEEKNDEEYAVEKSKGVEIEYNDPCYERAVEKSKGVEVEYNDPCYEREEDGWVREDLETGRGDGFGGEYIMEHDERKVEEEDLSDGNFNDEHGMDLETFKKERHDVVRERQKKKELEVFVGGLDRDTTEVDLKEVFSQVGDITEVRLLMNPMTNKNKGFAFIRFATVEQSRRALNELKRPVINGKQCGVAPSQDSDTLFVGNICKSWTKDMLKEKLVRYGIEKFEELTLVEDTKNEGMNRGFAFLDFPSRADALEACRRLQKRDVVFGTDRTARVAFADTFIEPDDEIMAEVRTVFVDGLPPSWGEDIIKDHLQQFGEIEKVQLARNMPAAKRDDFGFITFDTHESAVSCVDGINDSELVFRDKKVKVRARLSRPRQRGKSAKHARGGYPVGPDGYGGRSSWEPGMNRMDAHRFTDRDRRSTRARSPYDGGHRRSFDSRDDRLYEVSFSDRTGSRRSYTATDRPLKRRSPVYERSSFKTDYMRQSDSFGRSRDMTISSTERQPYRDSYSSRGSGYMEDTTRTVSRISGRKTSHPYDDDDDGGRYVYMDHPSSYHDSGSRNYSSASGLKRPYSSVEERHPHYTESSRRHSRAELDYANNSDLLYNERLYGTESTRLGRGSRSGYNGSSQSSAGHSHGQYEKNSSSVGYRRVDVSNEDPEEMYTRYGREREPREYIRSRSELRSGSYSPVYSNQRVSDGYVGGRVSDSYY